MTTFAKRRRHGCVPIIVARFHLPKLMFLARLQSMSFLSWASLAWRTISQIFVFPQCPDTIDQYPLTQEQLDNKRQAFIDSIDQDAVRTLASRYNNEEPCRIFNSNNGSFNACFFVEFLHSRTRWVVRIPIDPIIYDVWTKLQSEVMTMRYITDKTTIPLPRIHAYGRGERLIRDSPTTQAFLIIDFVPGQPLDLHALANDVPGRRRHFHSQLIEVMAQLRQLEFATAGSLMPDREGGSEPAMGNMLSIPINELELDRSETRPPPIFDSATSFALHQHQLMSEAYQLPRSELSRETAELELFALNHLRQLIPKLIAPECDGGPFVLCHSDLRPTNIIVDNDLNIRSIIDWEWAYTIPRQFFVPPSWITEQDVNCNTFLDFRETLHAKSVSSDLGCQLAREWGSDLDTLILPLAEILRNHSNLIHIYYKFVFPQSFQKSRDEVIAGFFQGSGKTSKNYALAVQQRITDSERYTQYLKDNGLYMPDEEARQAREWLEKARQLQEKMGIKNL
ncbi:hypothetical protein F66182_8823 [Fusarium sp. NRRL 66182]|nr:hypothetical protein F66182_8823 [Fusarium sp. NRRL 66182]